MGVEINDNRMELYKSGLSAAEIAIRVNKTPQAIHHWIKTINTKTVACKVCGELFRAKRTKGDIFQIICADCKTESLCWTCVNATPKLCLWVKSFTPIWDRATEKQSAKDMNGRQVTIQKVIECRRYVKEVEHGETKQISIPLH